MKTNLKILFIFFFLFKTPALFAGVADGVIDQVTQYPQLIKLGYEVATKPEAREGLWNSVKGISLESIKNAAVDFYEKKKANYTSNKQYIVDHTVAKDATELATIFIGGTGLKNAAKDVDDGVEKTGNKIKTAIENKKADLDKFMSSPDFENLMENARSRYKGQLSPTEWEAKYKTLYKNREVGKLTEEKFKELMGSDATHMEILTGNGKRYVDNVLNGTAREVKSGNVTWSSYREQVMKDIEIVKEKISGIDKIEWHCFGNVDDSFIKNVSEELKKAGMNETSFEIIKY